MNEATRRHWKEILFNRRMLTCIFLGFTSGMPLFVLFQLVPAWLRSSGIDLATIGLFALVSLPYTWKFLWSPLMDRFRPPFLGRRRGWALITQLALLVVIGLLGQFDPGESLKAIVWLVFAVALFSASQDIVIDAYRRELLPWSTVYWITAAFMVVGIVTTFVIREVSDDALAPTTLREAVIDPFREFFARDGIKTGLAILAFMFLYKLGDNMATALATPFYLDMGFSRTEIGSVAKVAALLKLSINKSLWIFGLVQMVTILGFAWLSVVGNNPYLLFLVVSGEYLGVGLGAVALTAFMARETSKAFTATQFALFTSLIAVPRTFANASTGFLIEAMGYTTFFLLCTALAIPGMLMLFKAAPWGRD